MKKARESPEASSLWSRSAERESPKKSTQSSVLFFKSVSETQEGDGAISPVGGQLSEKLGKGASLCRTMLTNVPYP